MATHFSADKLPTHALISLHRQSFDMRKAGFICQPIQYMHWPFYQLRPPYMLVAMDIFLSLPLPHLLMEQAIIIWVLNYIHYSTDNDEL